jgi:hypothetical protein
MRWPTHRTGAADILRRIFREFVSGHSPGRIAFALNKDNVPGPDGSAWADTTIRGHVSRGTGILNNELYAGRLVWNRQRYLKDPSTGRFTNIFVVMAGSFLGLTGQVAGASPGSRASEISS